MRSAMILLLALTFAPVLACADVGPRPGPRPLPPITRPDSQPAPTQPASPGGTAEAFTPREVVGGVALTAALVVGGLALSRSSRGH